MVSSGLVGYGYNFLMFRLHLWRAFLEGTVPTVASEVLDIGYCFPTYSICDITDTMSSWHIIGGCPAWVQKRKLF